MPQLGCYDSPSLSPYILCQRAPAPDRGRPTSMRQRPTSKHLIMPIPAIELEGYGKPYVGQLRADPPHRPSVVTVRSITRCHVTPSVRRGHTRSGGEFDTANSGAATPPKSYVYRPVGYRPDLENCGAVFRCTALCDIDNAVNLDRPRRTRAHVVPAVTATVPDGDA